MRIILGQALLITDHYLKRPFFPSLSASSLLDLPSDLLRLILSHHVIARCPSALFPCRFVCRRFRALLSPLYGQARSQGRHYGALALQDRQFKYFHWARANRCPPQHAAVVIDAGSACTRAGLTGDASPLVVAARSHLLPA